MNKTGDNKTVPTKAKVFKTKIVPKSKSTPKVSDNTRGLVKKGKQAVEIS